MSRCNLTDFEKVELLIACRKCHAPIGDWCRTPNGLFAAHLHGSRYYHAKKLKEMKAW